MSRVGRVIAAAILGSSFLGSEARADTYPESCRYGHDAGGYCIIIWEDWGTQFNGTNCAYEFVHPHRASNYNDLRWEPDGNSNPTAEKKCRPRKVNDAVSSLTNDSSVWVVFAEDVNLRGRRFCAAPYTKASHLSDFGANDIFSSHETSTSPPANCTWTSNERLY